MAAVPNTHGAKGADTKATCFDSERLLVLDGTFKPHRARGGVRRVAASSAKWGSPNGQLFRNERCVAICDDVF
jgi:hypothetical protein